MANRSEWHYERATGVGGSDAAAICGESPWSTPLDIYMSKVGYLDGIGRGADDETFDMRRGTLLEPVVLQLYTDETGFVVRKPDEAIVSPDYPFMRANLDGITPDGAIIQEAKTARWRFPPGNSDPAKQWGDPWTAEIPLVYLFQCQHNMVVARVDVCHVPVLFGDFEFAIYEVEADREFQELMIEQEARFWAMVEARTPPDPVNDADVSKRWPISRPTQCTATADDLGIAGHLAAVREYAKKLEAFEESLKAELKRSMQDNEELVAGNGEVLTSWKTAKGATRFDAKKFQAEHPDIYARYVYQSAPSRRFLFKDKAECVQIVKPLLGESLLPDRKLIGEH